jgi:hypothetical protein
MTLGRKDFSVTSTDGGADVFGLARFFRDDDLISHDGFVSTNRFDSSETRTYSERGHLASFVGRLRCDLLSSGVRLTRRPASGSESCTYAGEDSRAQLTAGAPIQRLPFAKFGTRTRRACTARSVRHAGAAPSISNRAKLVVHEVDPPLQLRDGLCLLKTPNEVVRDLVHLDKDSNFVPKSAFRRIL